MMTTADRVIARLVAEGYERQPMPFKIATVPFDFTAALRGPHGRSSDLVPIVDTLEESKGERLRQRVEAVSRALDVARSRLLLTVVLAGAPIPTATVRALGRSCRVLFVEQSMGDAVDVDLALEDALRVLLPLRLPDPTEIIVDPLGELQQQLARQSDSAAVARLLDVAPRGPDAVRCAFAELLEQALMTRNSEA